jgi:hypothetical protein
MNVVAAKNGNFFGATLKAVMVYDDRNFAARAAALLEAVARQADQNFKWEVSPWRLDILRKLSLTEIAEAETVDADVVVFALTESYSLPDDLVNWLEHWAARREIDDAAVMLIQPGQPAAPSPLAARLRLFAETRGLTFLDGHKVWPFGSPGHPLASPEQPANAEYPQFPDHWGLND